MIYEIKVKLTLTILGWLGSFLLSMAVLKALDSPSKWFVALFVWTQVAIGIIGTASLWLVKYK